jgi:anti-anti-sigma factor
MLSLPVDAKGLAEARSALASWLGRSGVSADDVDDVLIAGNEACMNAVEHSGADGDTKIDLAAHIDGTTLTIEVTDHGRWREPVAGGDRGHGLGLMRKLMDEVAIQTDGDGTHVSMQRNVAFGPSAERRPAAASVTIGEVRGVSVAIIQGDVDLAVVDRIAAELEPVSGVASPLVVDLTDVSYLDSAGVHLLFRLAGGRQAAVGVTRIVAPAGAVRRVLELTGVEATLGLDETVDQAIDRF